MDWRVDCGGIASRCEPLSLGKLLGSVNKERVLAVREILKRPEHVEGIDGILMADSLYCGYAGRITFSMCETSAPGCPCCFGGISATGKFLAMGKAVIVR